MLPPDARCLTCDYALRGLTARRCPECGRAFDPDDLGSVRLPRHLRPPRAPAVISTAGDVGLAVLGLTTVGRWEGATPAVALGWLGWTLLALLLAGQQVAGVLDWVNGPLTPAATIVARRSRRWAAGCLAAALACNVSWGSCPHSSWFIVGPVGLMRSPHGPCHNPAVPSPVAGLGGGWYVV